jgi:hypothetical protein
MHSACILHKYLLLNAKEKGSYYRRPARLIKGIHIYKDFPPTHLLIVNDMQILLLFPLLLLRHGR